MRTLPVLVLSLVSCLPQVGPPVLDGSMGGASGGSSGGSGGSGGGSAGGDPGCPGYAGCTTFTAGTAVTFPNGNDTYSPRCLRVGVGQPVTFTGSFSTHPLVQSCGPQAQVLDQRSGSSAQFTFTVPGTYGYYCDQHGQPSGTGMAGAIEVVP